MTDPVLGVGIASAATALLAKWCAKGGEEFFKAAGKDAWHSATHAIDLIRERFRRTPPAEAALVSLQSAPEEAEAQAAMRSQLESLIGSDPEFGVRLDRALKALEHASPKAGVTFNNTILGPVDKLVQAEQIHGGVKF